MVLQALTDIHPFHPGLLLWLRGLQTCQVHGIAHGLGAAEAQDGTVEKFTFSLDET